MEKHLTAIGVLYIVLNSVQLLAGIGLFVLLNGIGLITGDETAQSVLFIVGTALGALMLVLALPGIIGGIGLLKRLSWSRILLLVLGALNLLSLPFGTALGIYTIWAMLQDETTALLQPAR